MASNWTTGGPPGTGETAYFKSTVSGTITNTVAPQAFKSLEFDGNANALVIGSTSDQGFTVGSTGGITLKSTLAGIYDQNFNSPLKIGAGSSAATYSFTSDRTGAALNINGSVSANTTGTVDLTLSGTSTANNTVAGAILRVSSSSFRLIKSGTGMWTLGGANTYKGTTTVSGGTLNITGSLNSTTGTDLAFAENGTGATVNFNQAAGVSQGMGTLNSNILNSGDNTVISTYGGTGGTGSTAVNFSGVGSPVRGAGTTLNLVVSGGVNGSNNNIQIGDKGKGFLNNGYFFNGADYGYMNAANTYVRAPVYGTDSTAVNAGASLTAALHNRVATSITGQGTASVATIKFDGTGSVDLGLANNAMLTLSSAGLLRSGGGSTTISGTGTANISPSTTSAEFVFRTNAANDSLTVNVPILTYAAGTNGLTKSGAGTLTLGATNTFTGATYVAGGKLAVNGSIAASSSVTVKRAATLSGSGTVSATTIESGGILSPGTSVGTLTNTTAGTGLILQTGAIYDFEMGGTTADPTNDKYDLTGTSSRITLGSANVYTLKVSNLGTVDPAGKTFVLIDYTGTNPSLGTWNIEYTGVGTAGWSGGLVSVDSANTRIVLSNIVVPEPGTLGLLSLAGPAILLRRRRRNRNGDE